VVVAAEVRIWILPHVDKFLKADLGKHIPVYSRRASEGERRRAWFPSEVEVAQQVRGKHPRKAIWCQEGKTREHPSMVG
jgi:hypothetical protein